MGPFAEHHSIGPWRPLNEDKGLRSRSIVIVVGDHGELLGERDIYGHGKVLWEEVLRIPFVIHDPREPEGRRVERRVSLVDLIPTALDLLGIDAPDQGQGRSVADAVHGRRLPVRTSFGEARGPKKASEETPETRSQLARVSVYSGRYKLTLDATGKPDFYDLTRDPGEQSPIEEDVQPEMSTRFAEMEKLSSSRQELTKAALQRPSPEPDEETSRGLRILGTWNSGLGAAFGLGPPVLAGDIVWCRSRPVSQHRAADLLW